MSHNKEQMDVNIAHTEEISQTDAQVLLMAHNIAIRDGTPDDIINDILEFAGRHMRASCAYIVETATKTNDSVIYKWQEESMERFKEKTRGFPKVPFSDDEIFRHDMIIIDDIREIKQEAREGLEQNGIKSLAIIPLISQESPFGYVRIDACSHYHKWSKGELRFLQELANIFVSLISRRNAERSLRYSLEILHTVVNNVDYLIFICDLRTMKIIYVNDAMAKGSRLTPEEMKGKTCREIMMMNGEHACDNCPRNVMLDENGEIIKRSHTWELQNPADGKWYLVRANIIKWIDGKDVHLETATEITNQKKYEEKLMHEATIDRMTGIYNREWGRQLLQHILEQKDSGQISSLAFIDLDNLKQTNDRFGHIAGDEMILQTLEIIKSNIRKSDVLCRWGGDEFIAIFRSHAQETKRIIKKIKSIMSDYNELKINLYNLGFSYGIVEIRPDKVQTLDGIIKEADEKMYDCKIKNRM